MRKALLVIDMQNFTVGEKHAAQFKYNHETLIQAVNKVIDTNRSEKVVYIKHTMKKNLINRFAPFQAYEGTEEVELVSNLHVVSDDVFTKYKGNAFTNPELNEFLKKHGIEFVEVIGVDGYEKVTKENMVMVIQENNLEPSEAKALCREKYPLDRPDRSAPCPAYSRKTPLPAPAR